MSLAPEHLSANPATSTSNPPVNGSTSAKPKVGFLGVGWIGRHRMEAIAESGLVDVAAVADPSSEMAEQAAQSAPGAAVVTSLEELLDAGLDGIVIATPSALHAEHSIAALEHGLSVFCQKPLARTAEETRRVVDAARTADRLLGVDLSYRFINGMQHIRELARGGELGKIYAADLIFHNAYGPDKAWFYDPKLSGGGCVIDLGIHLVDLALWVLDFPHIGKVHSSLYSGGKRLGRRANKVEDYAVALIEVEGGPTLQLACSWKLSAGRDAVIEASFYGTGGGAALRNLNGSFYNFTTERYYGTQRELISEPPDEWGGRAAVNWARRLSAGEHFNPEIEHIAEVAAVLDAIYTL